MQQKSLSTNLDSTKVYIKRKPIADQKMPIDYIFRFHEGIYIKLKVYEKVTNEVYLDSTKVYIKRDNL